VTDFIYHITTRSSWLAAQSTGSYTPDSLASQGFIHCSKVDQVLRVANTFYHDQSGLVILTINPSRLMSSLRWEPGTDKADELFPHIYGPLNIDAVLRILDFTPGLDGVFHLPQFIGTIDS
jgi:uncharacterized protein (DUF952 family)